MSSVIKLVKQVSGATLRAKFRRRQENEKTEKKHLTSRGERDSSSAWALLPHLYAATSTSLLYLFIRSSTLLYYISTSSLLHLLFCPASALVLLLLWSRRLSLGAVDKFVRFMQSCLITLSPSLHSLSISYRENFAEMESADVSVFHLCLCLPSLLLSLTLGG